MKLEGIANENEFYTQHYVHAILENDLRDVFSRWAALAEPPYDALKKLRVPYEQMTRELSRACGATARLECRREWFARFFAVLGYTLSPRIRELEGGVYIPLAGEITRRSGEPELWILETLEPAAEPADPLTLPFLPEQTGTEVPDSSRLPAADLETVLTKYVFAAAEPPRWVLLFNTGQVLLLDRNKWTQKRMLRFDLASIINSRDDSERKAAAALLHHDSVTPAEGACLLDTLGENSHKHAFSVSQDLKYSAREAVELLGNEVIWYLRETHQAIYSEIDAEDLTRQCLRYLYRLLFLFFVEARPELGYAPMKSDEYRLGYSLESLRDVVEQGDLTTEESRNGYYLHESIARLFDLVWNGVHDKDTQLDVLEQTSDIHVFRMKPLQGDVFNPASTRLLDRVKFRNAKLLLVMELLSLTRPEPGRSRRRISYRELGINQLGAVYEGLLSYTGFFVKEKEGLYEVKKAGEPADPLKQAYFVHAADLPEYRDDEKVYDDQGRPKWYPQGTFIYRLAGRNRQKSASYYTPEVLTQCVVKYALKELLEGKTADQILELTICEPALGSGAFLNEALNQLADAYLDRKRKESHRDISHGDIERETQKVKAWLADNRVFGVDLNPVAVELAQISLWLNTIYEGHPIPWFGAQLAVGNSLIGARRQVFSREQVLGRDRAWLEAVPEGVKPGEERPEGAVYHFLLPDSGMANYTDRAVKQMTGDATRRIGQWRREFSARFDEGDLKALERLSAAADRLWKKHAGDLRAIRSRTAPAIPIFGQEDKPAFRTRGEASTTQQRHEIWRGILHPRPWSSPYERLKLAMDYWCALWFWPIQKAEFLPTRDQFLFELSTILEGTLHSAELMRPDQAALFDDGAPHQQQLQILEDHGQVDLDELVKVSERLKLLREVAERHRFLHWDLEFADIFADRGGFDLILGNPPWIKVEWNEEDVLSDFEPRYAIHVLSNSEAATIRSLVLDTSELYKHTYLGEYVEAAGRQKYFNATQTFPALAGGQSNTFKCFIIAAMRLTSTRGVFGYVHDDGLYTDPNGGVLRRSLYPRLRYWFQFSNDLPVFPALSGRYNTWFEVSICGPARGSVAFNSISDIIHPCVIDSSFSHDDTGLVKPRKSLEGEWTVTGHKKRIVPVDEERLALFARLLDTSQTPILEARLPSIYCTEVVEALEKISSFDHKLRSLSDQEHMGCSMWHEKGAVEEGIIEALPMFTDNPEAIILSGSHYFVANPYFKSARSACLQKGDFDVIDLEHIDDQYFPRRKYAPAVTPEQYERLVPRLSWDDKTKVTECYRFLSRAMLNPMSERTLSGCLLSKGIGHIHTSFSTVFKNGCDLINFACLTISLPCDFLIKTMRIPFANYAVLGQLPLLQEQSGVRLQLWARTLLLNCLTRHYAELWQRCFDRRFNSDSWTKADRRLTTGRFSLLAPEWQLSTPLRTDYERRQALVEIDVLAAMELGLTLDELCAIYRIQFPVLRQNEQETWYDCNGRIVFTCSKALPGVGFSRLEWEKVREMKSGTVSRDIEDDTLPGGPRRRTITYEAPFDRCGREEDYKIAWAEFEKRRAAKGADA